MNSVNFDFRLKSFSATDDILFNHIDFYVYKCQPKVLFSILYYIIHACKFYTFQLVIGVQWLVSDPADVLFNQVEESVIAVLSENNVSSTTISPIMTLKEVSAPQFRG